MPKGAWQPRLYRFLLILRKSLIFPFISWTPHFETWQPSSLLMSAAPSPDLRKCECSHYFFFLFEDLLLSRCRHCTEGTEGQFGYAKQLCKTEHIKKSGRGQNCHLERRESCSHDLRAVYHQLIDKTVLGPILSHFWVTKQQNSG